MEKEELLKQWMGEEFNKNNAEILRKTKEPNYQALEDMGINPNGMLYYVVTQTGGITFQSGWLRFIGAGCEEMTRSFTEWNQGKMDDALLVADDVLGGFYALLDENIYYLAPDRLEWEDLSMNYSDLLRWACVGTMNEFYDGFRWSYWEIYTKSIKGDQAINFTPNLWVGENNIDSRDKRIVSVEDLWSIVSDELVNKLDEEEDNLNQF